MDERLAHVRALVEERWRVAKEKRTQNEHLTRRVEAVERIFHGELLVKASFTNVEVAALEKQLVDDVAAEERSREELAAREKQRAKLQGQVWTKQRQIDQLKNALKDEHEMIEEIWAEMMADKARMQEDDEIQAKKEREEKRKEERIIKELRDELVEMERTIAAKKAAADKAKKSLEILKRRKRSVEDELQAASAQDQSLKSKIARLRGPNYVSVMEEGVDAILRELDDMGAR